MMGSLSRAGVLFLVEAVAAATLVSKTLWLVVCSVVDALSVGLATLSCWD